MIVFYSQRQYYLAFLCLCYITAPIHSFTVHNGFLTGLRNGVLSQSHSQRSSSSAVLRMQSKTEEEQDLNTRRSFLVNGIVTSAALLSSTSPSVAEEDSAPAPAPVTNTKPDITSKIYIQLKGLDLPEPADEFTAPEMVHNVITIGLYGKQAPQSTQILMDLASRNGYLAKCKPKQIRTLQREQLEANKVYNACIENESRGVTYDLSTVWRIVKDERIDLGAVSGKFVSRESPIFEENDNNIDALKLSHNQKGIVSVRKGGDGGFGFTIYPGESNGPSNQQLDEDNIIVGMVIDGMDVVERLNSLPVVRSSGASASTSKRAAPTRACRYGSNEVFCNEFKPLKKILISNTGVIS